MHGNDPTGFEQKKSGKLIVHQRPKQELSGDPGRSPDGPRDVGAGHHLPVRRGAGAVEADGQAAAAAEEVLRGHPAAREVQVRRHAAEDHSAQTGTALLQWLLLNPLTFHPRQKLLCID